jgi:hypothetical protein
MINIKKIDILDGLELKEATFKHKHFPTHFHETYSIGVIKNGIENLKIKNNNYIATPKTIVIINKYELHSNSFYNNENWTYQTINLNSDALSFLSKEINQKTDKNFVFKNFEILPSNFFTKFPVVIKSCLNAVETKLISWESIY